MNILTPFVTNANNLQAFTAFCENLKNPVQQLDDYTVAQVKLTCYRKSAIDEYLGTILLIHAGYGIGRIRISDGQRELMDENIFDVLENDLCRYSLGRSGSELIIDSPVTRENGIHRIDIEENVINVTQASQRKESFTDPDLFMSITV